ncbi:hypothetical protein ANN_22156 [Periplaneta americana]|uniref:ABC transporter domain-containing protein n=1 Tax=Periplaneta americana TaxID=6978 RepID=A0ABQ8S8B4_PERAM|nr:hypothetical protein ANN_22156 [Periplaneta americana]
MFENKVLRKIFGAKRVEVTGEWRKLQNAELHALYSSSNIIRNRRLKWAEHVARMSESRNAFRVLIERPKGKRPLWRPRHRWEDNIKMDLSEMGYDARDWINLAQDRDLREGGNETPGSLKAICNQRKLLSNSSHIVNEIIELLGLNKVTDTYVGKLSGGEKKRLSIGVELLTNPPFMFFDEPTSGLDSSSSYQVVTHLKSLAEAGRVIVCAIHQPSSRLFEMFDDVFILSEGNCFYRGPVNDMTTYFEEAGFVCPKYYNRADFAIEVVCGERGDNFGNLIDIDTERNYFQVADDATNNYENISEKTSMLSQIVGSSRTETTIQVMLDKTNSKERRFPVKLPTQFFILIKRCLLCTMRDLHMAQLRTIAHIVVGLLLGALYYGLGNEASKMSSNAACLFFFIMFLFFSNSMPTVHTFPVEASVFHREYLNNWYSLPAYYFSKIVAEIPLQAVVHDIEFFVFDFQILCPTLFLCIGYFLTYQPFEWSRFTQFWVLCVLVTILGQTMGLAIGAAFDAQV